MATQLANIVVFPPVAPLATVALPHNLNEEDTPFVPDLYARQTAGDFTIAIDDTNVTVTNNGAAPEAIQVFVWRQHTVLRAYGSVANVNLPVQPYELGGPNSGGGGGGGGTLQDAYDAGAAGTGGDIATDGVRGPIQIMDTLVPSAVGAFGVFDSTATVAYLLVVDVGTFVGQADQAAALPSGSAAFSVVPGVLTNQTDEVRCATFDQNNVTFAGAPTVAQLGWVTINAPALDGATITAGATLYIDNAPSGTSTYTSGPYSLWTDEGIVRHDREFDTTGGDFTTDNARLAIILQNNTAATALVSQSSPHLSFYSFGWDTDGGGTSTRTEYRLWNQSIAASPTPIGRLTFAYASGAVAVASELAYLYSAGQLAFVSAGSATSPSLALGANGGTTVGTTGWYAPAAGQIGATLAGTQRLQLDATNGLQIALGAAAFETGYLSSFVTSTDNGLVVARSTSGTGAAQFRTVNDTGLVMLISISGSGVAGTVMSLNNASLAQIVAVASGMAIYTTNNTAIVIGTNTIEIAAFTSTQYMTMSRRFEEKQGAAVATTVGGTVTFGGDGTLFQITGTDNIDTFLDTGWQDGSRVTVECEDTFTVEHGTGNILLQGAVDFLMAGQDTLTLRKFDGSWYEETRATR